MPAVVALSEMLACSGPGAGRSIARGIFIGYGCAALATAVTVAICIMYRRRGGKAGLAWAGLALLLLHPAWTVSATHGDCGMMKRGASYLVSCAFVALFVVQRHASRF